MKFADRLQIALFENVIVEMASFSLPDPIPIPNNDGKIILVKYLDMRWEDYRNPLIKQWGQWTPFIAELPTMKGHYLVWDGATASIESYDDKNYRTAPKKWWEMAQGMDEKGQETLMPRIRRKIEA